MFFLFAPNKMYVNNRYSHGVNSINHENYANYQHEVTYGYPKRLKYDVVGEFYKIQSYHELMAVFGKGVLDIEYTLIELNQMSQRKKNRSSTDYKLMVYEIMYPQTNDEAFV